jgi:dinuclear metal center YbgI/SA1388 family protein
MARTFKISDAVGILEARAPAGTAEDWDNVGLLAGDPAARTAGAVVTVDLSERAIDLAIAKGYRLIVNHHPCIFPKSRGLARVTAAGSGTGALVHRAIREGIAVVASHTNFDQCALEVVEAVAQGLGAVPRGRLIDKPQGSLLKLVTFVPATHLEAVRDAISEAGAGHVGAYDQCTFTVRGEGTFRGGEGTDPFVGTSGQLETAAEQRLETVLPRGLEKAVLQALFRAHPYEEVAFDLYPIEQGPAAKGLIRGLGYGFWGDLARPKSFSDLARDVKSLFKIDGFWVTDPPPARIKRVAFAAGKGASFIGAAASLGCDVFITGEAGYHTALEGSRRGIAVLELGHRESERFFAPTVRRWLSSEGLKSVELNLPTQKII